jgi:hypothetical protein
MAKQTRQTALPQTSLFPFFPETVNHRYAGAALAVLYFVLMLVVGLKYHLVGDYNVETDFYWSYVPQARHILEGTIPIEDYHGPVYPLVLAFISLFTSDLFHGGVILSTLTAAFTIFFTFELLKRLLRADMALIGTALVAANTTFVRYTYTAGTDMVFLGLAAASTYFLLRDDQLRRPAIALSAFFAALAYLTRYNGLSAAVGVPAAIILANPFQLDRKERVRAAGLFLGVFLLTIAPWGIYCLVQKGSFFYNRNYLNIAYEMFAKGRIGWDQYWYGEAQKFTSLTQVVFADPVRFVTTLGRNLVEHAVSDFKLLLGWYVGVFAVLGIYGFIKYRPGARMLSYFIIGVAFFGLLLLVFYGERFSMYLLPIYAALAVKALTLPALAQYRFWKVMHAGGMLGIVLIIWTAVDSIQFNRTNIDSGPQEAASIGSWFRQNTGGSERGKIVVARKPHIAYYLGLQMEMFPMVDSYPQLLAELKRIKASYLYFSVMEAGMRPQFQRLLDPRVAPKELRPLTYTTNPPAVLYKVELEQTP